MVHTQEIHQCQCGRKVVVDFMINGSPHHTVLAVTCLACVTDPNRLLGDRTEPMQIRRIQNESERTGFDTQQSQQS